MTNNEIKLLKASLDKYGKKIESIIYGIKVSKTGDVTNLRGKEIKYGWIVSNMFMGKCKRFLYPTRKS